MNPTCSNCHRVLVPGDGLAPAPGSSGWDRCDVCLLLAPVFRGEIVRPAPVELPRELQELVA